MKTFLSKIGGFFKTHGHKLFSFLVGLAFIALICFAISRLALAGYRVFVPSNIYTDPAYKGAVSGSLVFETHGDVEYEEASKEFFENYLANFVMQDMPDFDDPLELNDEYIISYGLWQAITLNNNQSVYTYNKNGSFRVPHGDVETLAAYTFDYPEKINHRTVDVCGKFRYNSLNGTYSVPSANLDSYLVPDVVNVEQGENDTYVITVDCYEASALITQAAPESDPRNFNRRLTVTLQDMGVQNYNSETGEPVRRYMILSSDTVNEPDKQDIDLN